MNRVMDATRLCYHSRPGHSKVPDEHALTFTGGLLRESSISEIFKKSCDRLDLHRLNIVIHRGG